VPRLSLASWSTLRPKRSSGSSHEAALDELLRDDATERFEVEAPCAGRNTPRGGFLRGTAGDILQRRRLLRFGRDALSPFLAERQLSPAGFDLILRDRSAARRTFAANMGHQVEGFLPLGSLRFDHFEDLGNHHCGPADDIGVCRCDVLAVISSSLWSVARAMVRALDKHRFPIRHGRQHAVMRPTWMVMALRSVSAGRESRETGFVDDGVAGAAGLGRDAPGVGKAVHP